MRALSDEQVRLLSLAVAEFLYAGCVWTEIGLEGEETRALEARERLILEDLGRDLRVRGVAMLP